MRIYDDRYSRDRQRLETALRFIEHEARTQTIRRWTGLSDDRIRKLYRSYLCDGGRRPVMRHRGRSPHQTALFLRTARMRHESAVFASICRLVGVLGGAGGAPAPLVPGIRRGTQLCQAYEIYRGLIASPQLTFEHAVFLAASLAASHGLALARCGTCGALVVVEPAAIRAPRCAGCGGDGAGAAG